jgi:DNA repair protein RadA/Sms
MPDTIQYICPECGTGHTQWMGFCFACGSGSPLEEAPTAHASSPFVPPRSDTTAWTPRETNGPTELSEVSLEDTPRITLPYPEMNRVLGGGLVPGSVVLLAGDPGIGKSTLMLQIAGALAPAKLVDDARGSVLYVSGEESATQVRLRAERLGISGRNLLLLNETAARDVLGWMDKTEPVAVLVDSIQTLYTDASTSAPGSVTQIREGARLLMGWAKANRTPVIIAGHVTKEGDVAGPRVLEHMVDVVLYLEGDRMSALRILRSEKNRFGSTDEVALFQMEASGLEEVSDPSGQLLSHRKGPIVGSVVTPVLQGTRPMLVEIQALTAPVVGPTPRRVANGMEGNRLVLLATVLSRRAGIPLGGQDIVVNVTGGLRVTETSADLATALAIASSFRDQPLETDVVALGEVGLGGEVRSVSQIGRRLQEAARLGLRRAVIPETAEIDPSDLKGIEIIPVATLTQAIHALFPRARSASRGERVPVIVEGEGEA